MAGPESVVQKVLKLKEQLSHTQDPPKIIKALKGLEVLEISLDTLVETGVGKTVNSFRKHPTVGNLAKSLIRHWKKLVPQDHARLSKRKHIKKREKFSAKNKIKLSLKENKHSEECQISTACCKNSPSDKQRKAYHLKDKQRNEDFDDFLTHANDEQSDDIYQNSSRDLEINSSKHHNKESKERKKPSAKHSSSAVINRSSKKNHFSPYKRESSLSLKVEKYNKDELAKSTDAGLKGTLKPNSRSKSSSSKDFEPPTMSFESYLNYDQVSSRKKRKTCPVSSQVVNGTSVSQKNVISASDEKEEKRLKSDDLLGTPAKKAKTSLQDLLNTPLPKLLPEISISSPPYATECKVAASAVEIPQQGSETVHFTGRRLNSKMQVYSGSKTVYLPKMLTLYEQCIRVLQNNIDSLHEVGDVPFEILEPVLTRCTSEQLFQIEDYNPMFTELSDHLWKKHCQRDFRNEQPLEDESWREMYLRVFRQREEKLKSLTRSILSAQSEKLKGRQVKMAFVHCVAKPPRNVRRQQEIHGTASYVQPELLWARTKHPENGESGNISASPSYTKGSSAASTNCASYANGTNQDAKKPSKKIAPMMRKSLRAFKNKVGPW